MIVATPDGKFYSHVASELDGYEWKLIEISEETAIHYCQKSRDYIVYREFKEEERKLLKINLDGLMKEILVGNDRNWADWDKDKNYLYWTTCLAGEVGELCNLTKKYDRFLRGWSGKKVDHETFMEESELEMGDIFIYWVLMCRIWGIDPIEAIQKTLDKNYKRFSEAEESYCLG